MQLKTCSTAESKKMKSMAGATKPTSPKHKLRTPTLTSPKSEACSKAAVILERSHDSSNALLQAFELAQAQRGTPRGMSTDAEQDLLRAMLVMAAAGLDSMLKQLIRDSLSALVRANECAREGLEKFVTRSIRGDAESPDAPSGAKFLGRVLAAESQQAAVIEEYVRDLTGGSLQSAAELARTAREPLHNTPRDC